MSEAITSSSDPWIQFHNQYQYQNFDESAVPHGHGGLSDSISVSSSFTGGHDTMNNMLVPENNSCAVGNDLSPRASIGKSVRRRSRVSRRTPTTLLNANIKNFRTLVQQYTGCHTISSSSKNQKGPINLSFGTSSRDQPNDFSATNSFGGRYYSGQPHFEDQNQNYQHQEYVQMFQGQQGLFPQDENNIDDFPALSSSGQNMMTVNNFGWQ